MGLALAACGRFDFTPAHDDAGSQADATVAPDAKPLAPLFMQFGDNVNMSGASITASTPQPVTAGDLLLVTVDANTGTLQSVSDTNASGFTMLPPLLASDMSHSYVAYAIATSSNAETVTVTLSQVTYSSMRVHEYAHVDPSDPIDLYETNVGSAITTGAVDVPITTTRDAELLFGYAVALGGQANAGSGFQQLSTASGDISEDAPAATAGTYDVTALDSGSPWVIWAIALRGD